MKKQLSIWILAKAEAFFLKAHGWDRAKIFGDVMWMPPGDYPFRYRGSRTRGHAVNSEKQRVYNPAFGGTRERDR